MKVRRIAVGVILTALMSVALVSLWPKAPLARVTLREGTVQRDHRGAEQDFHTAALGDPLDLGDALRTGKDSRAHLSLSRGTVLAVAESTVVRLLSDAPHTERFRVEEGSIDIEAGDAELSFATGRGTVRVARGTRVSVRDDGAETWVRVDMGRAELDWDPAHPLLAGTERASPKDTTLTGIQEQAPAPTAPEVQPPAVTEGVAAVVRGAEVRVQLEDAAGQASLAPGAQRLPLGARIAVEDGSSVELSQADGGKLITYGRAELVVGDGLAAKTRVVNGRVHALGGEVSLELRVPGGRIVLLADDQRASSGALHVAGDDTEVYAETGAIVLHDAEGEHRLAAGARGHVRPLAAPKAPEPPPQDAPKAPEPPPQDAPKAPEPPPQDAPKALSAAARASAKGAKSAKTEAHEDKAPDYDVPELTDLTLPASGSVEVHDPAPPTAVRFALEKLCGRGEAVLEQKTRRGYAQRGAGKAQLLAFFAVGSTNYRVRCRGPHGALGNVVAHGRIRVRRDRAERRVTKRAPEVDVELDGRKYTAVYQTSLPRVHVRVASGAAGKLRVSSGAGAKTYTLPASGLTLGSGELGEGVHTLHLTSKGEAQVKDTTLTIRFDNATPAAYLEGASGLKPGSGGRYTLRGGALPKSQVFVDGVRVRLDDEGRFEARLPLAKGARGFTLFIKNPRAGSHYYVRRVAERGK